MVIYRTNSGRSRPAATSDERLCVVERHHAPKAEATASAKVPDRTPFNEEIAGDIIYGAKAIAHYLFGADDTRTRRRVFNLWSHYRDRKEKAGFFKLKGALCLSKSQWRIFHGL